MIFTTREIATGVVFIAFVILAIFLSNDRKGVLGTFTSFLRALGAWKVWSVFLAYGIYVTSVILLAWALKMWSLSLLKDTLIVAIFGCIPIVVAATSKKTGGELLVYVRKQGIGVIAAIVAYLNLATLDLWAEILIQLVLVFLVLCGPVAMKDPNTARVGRAFIGITLVIMLGLLVHTSTVVANTYESIDWSSELATFALSVWLPFAVYFFAYPLAFISACEVAIVRMKLFNNNKRPSLYLGSALIAGFRGRLVYASRFTMGWIPLMAKADDFREARHIMRRFRRAVRDARIAKRRHRADVKARMGVSGLDSNGNWIDRREFHETKQALESLRFIQMGYARNHNSTFTRDPLKLMVDSELESLPKLHGIETQLSADRKSWMAWRKTAGQFYLGVSGNVIDINEVWRYSGSISPSAFPNDEAAGWTKDSAGRETDEWHKNDWPLPDVLPPRRDAR
ncbi:hypothetical protein [Mycetocola saprophilus]|uniref:hypothetical protein n=1 Tax=Mycetocola saprophilus TaxID=76636 RepID=UPI0004C236F3|nr:hypothetical protein [Mycetocola saprophilus]